ncbi:MAG: T9SS type A sorting domain-containing protein [Candidatus Eisenbacteria bacterium]|uniref:T9SS type A sorting domain-containing protein n=1 Tax=Eiseniibacteriota bacterium TaxID=2212470 RepID=A0A538SY94_UNCEI|nr:MAG: T9SS type A sorting domain-containing protein [Candidatus Eisenbacteria bacterium]TMQ62026.1 MAG: T9SS type A sorting domain-containing protein [Candidatus Eisenbacteria bacterium]
MFLKRMLYASASILMLAAAYHLGANSANASTIVYSTFNPGDTYDVTSGWTIGDTPVVVQALQFTPTESGMVQTIEIAAFRIAGGTAVNVSLTTDAGDQPGSVLETVPVCCFGDIPSIQLANSVLHPKLSTGTKYWLVVSPVAAGDHFGWNRLLDPPYALNAQQSMGGPWSVGLEYRGTARIRGDASTPTIAMAFDFKPDTLNLSSHGRWVTGFLEPASPFAASDIDIASIRLNGAVPVDPATATALGDHDGNGVPDLMVKFDRAAVGLAVSGGDDVPVDVTGTVDAHSFLGTDHIRVLRAVVSAPMAGSHLTAGADASETSSSAALVGAGGQAPAQFALRGVTPNPARHELQASFSLRDSRAATLALFDVSGRQLEARRVEGMGPGWHTVEVGRRSNLAAGVYFIRLTQDGRSLTTRAAVVR